MLNNFTAMVESHIDAFESQLFTALPARVISYDSVEQTITAKPVMLEPYSEGLSSEAPEIDDIPVMFPSGGGGSLTFPIQVGDEVLLVFSARNYDTWWETGGVDQLSTTQRFHDITDAIAIIGLTSKNNSVEASTEDVELKFNDSVIRIKADKTIEVETQDTLSISNSSEELISLFSEILEEVSNITTQTVYGITPVNNKVQILALKERLDTFKK